MPQTRKRALRIAALLLIAAVISAVAAYWLLGGMECIRHISAVKPEVESRFRFGDLNAKHLKYAKSIGIELLEEISDIGGEKKRLCKVRTGRRYLIAPATHSHPYLVPEAAQLLKDIGRGFQRRLSSEGYHPHMVVVTSVLRTKSDVKQLQKVNNVAVSNSAHLNGTTFDISYARYAPWLGRGKAPTRNELALALGETLQELRDQGRCCVKYEHSTNCYHITVRK